MMSFYFKPFASFIGLILIAGMIRASYWQYERYVQKMDYIELLGNRLKEDTLTITELTAIKSVSTSLEEASYLPYIHRRVSVAGAYDFEHEIIIRNRRLDGMPGIVVLTPLKIKGTDLSVLVNRGFIPLAFSSHKDRSQFQRPQSTELTAIIKSSVPRRIFAPADPSAGPQYPWVDAWLRPDIISIRKQIPYPLLPIFLEILESPDGKGIEEKIISSSTDKEQILTMPGGNSRIRSDADIQDLSKYPIPIFSTVIPAGRHKGYIYEWALMALATLIIVILIQLKPPRYNK